MISRSNRSRARLIVGLFTFLALLLAGILAVAMQFRALYERNLIEQVWPAGTANPVRVSGEGARTIMLFGDSRVTEWTSLSISNCRTVNAGNPGATTGQLCLILPRLLAESDPSVVVIQAGINDLKLIGIRPDLEDLIVANATANFSNIVTQCLKKGCRVLVTKTWPPGPPSLLRRPIWNQRVAAAVQTLNSKITEMHAPEKGVRVLDLFKSVEGLPVDKVFRDTLHLKPQLYETLSIALLEELENK